MTRNTKPRLVVLTSGEQLETRGQDTEDGVHTDAGVHCWGDVASFRCWSHTHRQYFSVPVVN